MLHLTIRNQEDQRFFPNDKNSLLRLYCLKPKSLNSEDILSKVSDLNADIVLSLQNNMIFSLDWIKLFKNKLKLADTFFKKN